MRFRWPVTLLLGGFFIISLPVRARSAVLTVSSDLGVSGDNVYTWSDFNAASFNGGYTGLGSPPEGQQVFRTAHTSWAGWGVFYNTAQNFSAYGSGELRFWIYSTTGDIKVEIENGSGVNILSKNLLLNGWNWSTMNNRWVQFRFGLSGLTLTSIKAPFKITANRAATFHVDFVRWTSSTSNPMFNVALKNLSNNATASTITWSGSTTPGSWVRADQYINLELDPDTTGWGLQIYTDNKANDASPQYTGSGDPAGLVDTTTTTKTLPMAWSIKDTTSTQPAAADPNDESNSDSFQWLFFKDRGTPGFADGDTYMVVKKPLGIHFGEQTTDFGAANTSDYIYLEGDATNAVTPRTYKTNTIRLEFYRE